MVNNFLMTGIAMLIGGFNIAIIGINDFNFTAGTTGRCTGNLFQSNPPCPASFNMVLILKCSCGWQKIQENNDPKGKCWKS